MDAAVTIDPVTSNVYVEFLRGMTTTAALTAYIDVC